MKAISDLQRTALTVAAAAWVTLLAPLSTHAATPDASRVAKAEAELKARFDKADANHDALLTRDEAKGKMPRVYSHFDEIDAAHKGAISLDDIETFLMGKLQEQQKQVAQK